MKVRQLARVLLTAASDRPKMHNVFLLRFSNRKPNKSVSVRHSSRQHTSRRGCRRDFGVLFDRWRPVIFGTSVHRPRHSRGFSLVLFRPVSTFRTEPVTAGVGGREHKPFGGFLSENQFLQISSQVNPIHKRSHYCRAVRETQKRCCEFCFIKERRRKTSEKPKG